MEISIGRGQKILGRIVCECGWGLVIGVDSVKEDVEAASWDHYHGECVGVPGERVPGCCNVPGVPGRVGGLSG